MEKIVFLLMGPTGTLDPGAAAQLTQAVPSLEDLGARWCQVNVTDPSLGFPFGVTPEADQPQILAAVSVWVDSAETSAGGLRRRLPMVAGPGGSWHGWLVCESEPLSNTTAPPGADGLVPGFAQIVALVRPASLGWSEWRRIWQGGHTAVAINTQSTFRYVQNVVFRALTPGAPPYAAVVEECFPIEAATDLHVFFASGGDDAKLGRHMAAMSESCDRFMDGDAPVSWTREWLFA